MSSWALITITELQTHKDLCKIFIHASGS